MQVRLALETPSGLNSPVCRGTWFFVP